MTAIVSVLVPALGTYGEYGITPDPEILRPTGYLIQLDQLPRIRDGSLRLLASEKLGGIITFPSFHAAAAILSLWALWSIWWVRPLALIANIGMLLATPLIGGHYFIDVFAGGVVAAAAIALAQTTWRMSDRKIFATKRGLAEGVSVRSGAQPLSTVVENPQFS